MNDNLNNLITTLGHMIPENSGFLKTIDGYRVSASNIEGNISVRIEPNDSKIKELISDYKKNMDKLDDCLFLEVLDEIKDHINLKTFDELLEQDVHSEEDIEIVKSMISFTNLVVHEHIENKIQDLKELLNKF